jgi:hypothetical protein
MIKMSVKSSQNAGKNGVYIEILILGKASNPENIIDDIENKIEIKSCQEYILRGLKDKRKGYFKINYEQHKYLLDINGYYLFIVQNKSCGEIIYKNLVLAKTIEKQFNFINRKITKHHYFNLLWTKTINIEFDRTII